MRNTQGNVRRRRGWGMESNHSPQNLHAHDEEGGRNGIADVSEEVQHQMGSEDAQETRPPGENTGAGKAHKEPVNWPLAAAKWGNVCFHDVDQVSEAVLSGDVRKKLKAMSAIIWNTGVDCFVKKELKARSNTQPKISRRLGDNQA